LLRRGILAALILSSSLLTFVLSAGAPPYRVWASLAGNLHFFLVGFLLCDGYLTAPAGALRKRYWDILFLAAAAVFLALGKHPFVVLVVHPWLMFVCGSAALRGKACYALFGSAWIATIGGMCYTIYLYHMFLISCLIRLTTRLQTHVLWMDLLIQFALILPVILVVCAVLFKLFERPFMQRNWHLNLWRRLRSQLGSFRSSSAIH
jgi:peptidoglycan/LPS O-acetylase OafA/YrhL